MDTSDGAIVERVLSGDVDAYEVLVYRYYQRCSRYALRMLGDEAEARDVVQEAFVRAYRSLASYRDEGRFDAWLFRILVNRCRTAGARRERRRRRFMPFAAENVGDPGASQESSAERVLWRAELSRALAALARPYREAFLLKYMEELSYEEMAALTGEGVSALKMRVKRARDELRSRLEDVYRG